jgi:hypothetical protein
MLDGADVRSIDAIRDWHATLAGYGEVLAEALAGVELELRRGHDWIDEQLALWQRAVRDCEDEVTRAKAELAQRKFPNWDGRMPDCTVQERNLKRAFARLEHARDRVAACRQWQARLPKLIDETYTGTGRRLAHFLETVLPQGLAELARRIAALELYVGLRNDYAPASSSSSTPVPAATPTPTPAATPTPTPAATSAAVPSQPPRSFPAPPNSGDNR